VVVVLLNSGRSNTFVYTIHNNYSVCSGLSKTGMSRGIGDMSPYSGCTVVSGVVVVVVGVCNRSQMRTSKCKCLIFGVSIGLDPG